MVFSYVIYFLVAFFTGSNPLLTAQKALLVLPVVFGILLIPLLFISDLSPPRRIAEREMLYVLGHVSLIGTSVFSAVVLLLVLGQDFHLMILATVVEMIGAPIGFLLVWSSRAPKAAPD
jgi:hypothetical protein